ncbi:MAG: hypothetical protein IIZ68_01395, partial [Clostridia bacterium]|nr:hypothetical protein [Clostridia bacterium]
SRQDGLNNPLTGQANGDNVRYLCSPYPVLKTNLISPGRPDAVPYTPFLHVGSKVDDIAEKTNPLPHTSVRNVCGSFF